MARFDLYRAETGDTLFVDIQHRSLDHLRTRVVIPLMPPAAVPEPIRGLHPIFVIDGERWLLVAQLLGSTPKRQIGKPVGNPEAHRDAVTKALDVLLTGF